MPIRSQNWTTYILYVSNIDILKHSSYLQIPWHPKNPSSPCMLEVITDHASKEIQI